MKNVLFVLAFLTSTIIIFAQAAKYQTYSAGLMITATKNGDINSWQNKDIIVTLNYKTGDLKMIINNNDFYNKETNNNVNEDNISDNREFLLVGNLPIDQVINQKTINQDYDIELQLTNNDFAINEVINFKMNIMRPNTSAESYRVFTFTGVLYNDELNLPAFKGFDNNVEIRIFFNAFWNGR